MEDNTQKKNKFQQFYAQFRTSFFNIMFELLKEKNTGIFLGCLIILIMFIQIIGLLFEPDKFEWRDEFFLSFVIQVCNYCRVIKAINEAGSTFFYWALMFFGIFYLVTMIALLVYMNYFLKNRKQYVEHVVKLLRIMILLLYWIFYMPFFESFISILNCVDGVHYLDSTVVCFSGIHIFYFVICMIFLVLLFSISIIIAMLYNETQPVQDDCLSRLESSFEVALVIYRSIVATFANFCSSEVCSWVLISVFIISSAMLCYQFYKQIPYYNSFVSVFCGSLIFNYFWISINALLMKLLEVNGHLIIIFVGIPLISYLVKNLREKRIENLMKTNIDKLKLDIDALIQVHNMTDFSKGIHKDQAHRMTMIGIVNLHILECQNSDCPCKEEYELFDVTTSQFSERNRSAPHQDEVFLNHLIKRLYEDGLNKFINSPSIHIAFAFYLFKVMKNIHASLVELNIAIKKKPSLQQQFTIFRYKNIIEDYIKQDHLEHKYVYPELTNVIEFERLFGEMQKAIEKVCNLQVEFWTHLTTVVPDLNILNDIGKKIYEASREAEQFWNELCKINQNYQQALNIYGEYLREIRNHEHLGNTYIERAYNTMNAKKSVDEHLKTSDILFGDDTTVLHVSGNKESIGKILKTSQGLSKVFGYSKTEVIGHSINILMPTLFAKKHTDFLERFFRTGRQVIFYQERTLFATHRNGHCFQMKILVKQMPSLAEGIQYVGLVKPIASDYEYMLTDMDGVIDSFSKGVTGLLGLTPNLFKDKDSQINIQILAPELIPFFLETQNKGRAAKSKYRDAGGDNLTLVVPRDFHQIAKSESKQNPRAAGGRSRGRSNQQSGSRNRSAVFKQFLKCLSKPKKLQRDRMPTTKQIMSQPEYLNFERKKDVICEITCLDIKASTNDSMKLLVFKFSKNDKGDKKKVEDINQLMGQFENIQQVNETGYDQFKQISLVEESRDDFDNSPMLRPNISNNNFGPENQNLQQQEKKEEEVQQPGPNQVKGGIQVGTLNKVNTVGTLGSVKTSGQQAQQDTIKSGKNIQSSKSSQQQQQEPNVGVSVKDVSVPGRIESKELISQKIATVNDQQMNKKNLFSGQDDNIDKNDQDEEEKKEPDFMDYSEIETPKLDVSGIKLDSAQKEKNSFLEELKKQSFILSENSTQKMEAKESLNISHQQKQEKKSFEMMQKNNKDLARSQTSSMNQDAKQMVKKQNENNMNRRFGGDDDDAPQDVIKENEDLKSEDSQEEKKSSKSKKSIEDGDSDKSDDDEEQEQEEESEQEDSVSKSKSKSKSSKKRVDQSNFDSEENEEDYEEENSRALGTAHPSNASIGGSKESRKQDKGEKQPLMSARKQPYDIQPNMNDLKRGFDDDQDYQQKCKPIMDPRQSSGKSQQSTFNKTPDGSLGIHLMGKKPSIGGTFKKMALAKRDTNKIRTNPKYKCMDEGSEDEETNKNMHDDPQALSSKELDFRETILKFEKRRKRKERKQREKEQKKIKAINGEDSASSTLGSGEATAIKTAGGSEDEEIESQSSSSSSEDTKEDKDTPNGKLQNTKKTQVRSNNDEGEVSSVTTRQSKTERNHYILRMAIDEKYIPNSIQNLRFAAYMIFIILTLLSIVYYVIQISLFDKINQNIKNIHNSELRLNYIIDITLRTRTLILMNEGYLNLTPAENATLFNTTMKELRASATNLKNAQTELSLKTSKLSSDQLQKINPDDVKMEYSTFPNMPGYYIFSIWEAIMEIVVSAYRISTLRLVDINQTNPTTYFVMKNCLNSVLQALQSSTDAIILESESSRTSNMSVFLYLLIAASCALFISLLFLTPVINKVKKNKQEVLELFTHKNIEKHIDDQLKVCRNFVSMRLQQNNEGQDHDIDGEDANMNVNDKELQNELNNNKYMKRIKKKNKGKKWKKLNTDFGATLLKFLLFICIIEGYFLACYLLSFKFLQEVQDLTQELKFLISRQPVQSFLLLIQKELIYSNGTALIEDQPSISYVPAYHEQLYDEEEQLLDKFSQNYDYHSGSYNDDFNNIIYSNVCQYVEYSNQTACESFNQGILKKGIYSSVIKYWDFLRQLNHDFLESKRTNATIKTFLNEQRLQVAEKMQDYYFKLALAKLVTQLEDDIDYFFNIQYIQNRTIFIIYILYIVILYFLIWRKFVSIMQNELWKTKSMLSILPTKICFEIEEIRYFIYANSSNDFLSSKL